jgi:hypothetical protein
MTEVTPLLDIQKSIEKIESNLFFRQDRDDFKELLEEKLKVLMDDASYYSFVLESESDFIWLRCVPDRENKIYTWDHNMLDDDLPLTTDDVLDIITLLYFEGRIVQAYFILESELEPTEDNKPIVSRITNTFYLKDSRFISYYTDEVHKLRELASTDPSEYVEKLQNLISNFRKDFKEIENNIEPKSSLYDVFHHTEMWMSYMLEIMLETFKNMKYYNNYIVPIECNRVDTMWNSRSDDINSCK